VADELAIPVARGDYWLAVHPVADSFNGQSFWLTSPVTDCTAAFLSRFFGYNEWTPIKPDTNVAFCIQGIIFDDGVGRCCLDGDCRVVSEDDCTRGGGDYAGDCTTCVPNDCPGAPGACCLPEGGCESLKLGACDEAGGAFQGEGVECECDTCALADFCADSVYDNGRYNGITGYFNARSFISAETADDYVADGSTQITGMTIFQLDLPPGGNFDGIVEVTVRGDASDFPDDGNILFQAELEAEATDTCEIAFGFYPIVAYAADGIEADVTGGQKVWLSLRPVYEGTGSYGYHATADVRNTFGRWRAADFGYPDWTHIADYDWAWCIRAAAPCSANRGDSDLSGEIDFDDIDCFVAAIIGPAEWADCSGGDAADHLCINDIDQDGDVDFDDIDPFVECIINGSCE
jgi:hypothetical protein